MRIKSGFLGLFLPIALVLLALITWYGRVEIDLALDRIRNQELLHVGLGAGALGRSMETVVLDLHAIAQNRALLDAVESTTQVNLRHIAGDWAVISNGKAIYDQIRWIDEKGMERVRVDYVDGRAVVVTGAKLQNKGSRYYVTETLKLKPGGVFISPLDLNIEQDKIELPYKPMLRVATPIVDSQGNQRGIVVLNYHGRLMLDAFGDMVTPIVDHIMLLNSEGYWLKSPKVADEWGFMFNRADLSLAVQSPSAWARVRSDNAGQLESPDGLWTWQSVYPLLQAKKSRFGAAEVAESVGRKGQAGQYVWEVVAHTPAASLADIRRTVWRKLSLLGALLLGLTGFGSWKLSRAWDSQAEAEAEIRRINAGLAMTVAQRTQELQATVQALDQEVTQRKGDQETLRISATAFESQQGMVVTDARQLILKVNRAFTDITGYSAEEAIGKSLRMLSSDRQDAAFYTLMWDAINRKGSWQGEIWNRRKNGEVYPEWLTISAVKDVAGVVTHYVGAFSDRSDHKAAEQRIENLAFYDTLTGLPNRALMLDRLSHALTSCAQHHRQGALLLIDLDNFKTINDTLGHEQGNLLIQQVATRLGACVRESDTVARVGGDEFIVLLEDLSQNNQGVAKLAKATGDKILAQLDQPYQFCGVTHHSTASIGVTLFDSTYQNQIEEPLKQAELAMYQAKTAGRNTLRFFDPQMQAAVSARAALESRLREAVTQNQFLLHYQPQVDAKNRITGAEALLRWVDPKRGMVSPGEFIPVAEESGLILSLGQWVLETACTELTHWAHQPSLMHLTLSVNVSARQFHQKEFVQQVLATLSRTGANPHRLKLELTESMLVDDIEGVITKMSALKGSGVSFSLDDFGTGYSSLAYLKRLPLDQLKIDQGFVRDILIDSNDAAIAKTVIGLAEAMGLSVIAEGVETQAQREFLVDLGCPSYQGYLFSRPLPLLEFAALVERV